MKNNRSILFVIFLFLLLMGCSTSAKNNLPNGDDPVSWINFEGAKYDFYRTDVSVGDSLVSTTEKTDADDGTESGLEIFEEKNGDGRSLFIQDPMNQEWAEYRLK